MTPGSVKVSGYLNRGCRGHGPSCVFRVVPVRGEEWSQSLTDSVGGRTDHGWDSVHKTTPVLFARSSLSPTLDDVRTVTDRALSVSCTSGSFRSSYTI